MALDFWVRVFDRLLPRSRAFHLTLDRTLKKYFEGLSALPEMVKEHVASVLLEAFPQTTTRLSDWSLLFGSPQLLSADEVAAEWKATGGQTPQYIQDILQDAGYDVYVHEWWVPDSAPPVARNPFSPINLIETSRVLVNDLAHIEKKWTYQFGDGTQFQGDGEISFGAYDGYHYVPKVYPTPNNPGEYPVYFYICGETWPEYAMVLENDIRKLIRLIYKLKPVHLRCILRVTGYCDGDIQDTVDHDDQYQDTVDNEDQIQDTWEDVGCQ